MATYNQYRTSPIRTRLTDKTLSDTIIGKLDADESLMRNIARTVNRTLVYSAEGNIVDENQCEHVTDRLWFLGLGHINSSAFYFKDDLYDSSKFTGKFTDNASRIKYLINSDGSTSGTAETWWLRSASWDGSYDVGFIGTNGIMYGESAAFIQGCSPAFQIG